MNQKLKPSRTLDKYNFPDDFFDLPREIQERLIDGRDAAIANGANFRADDGFLMFDCEEWEREKRNAGWEEPEAS